METGTMSVKEAYDHWAGQYDDNDNRTRDLNVQCLRSAGLPLAGARVFEAGCGTGLNTEYLASQADRVVAMDFSEGMLEPARRRVASSTVRFVAGDITAAWPVEEASCNLAVITLVLEHIDDLAPVFVQARRWRRDTQAAVALADGALASISAPAETGLRTQVRR